MLDFRKHYNEVIVPDLKKAHSYSSAMAVPKLEKITLNRGLGKLLGDKKGIDKAVEELTLIGNQRAVKTLARKSIAGFKIRDGWPVGCRVTLRKANMYAFLERLISVVLPRVRDFQGLSPRSFDGRGNYSFGLKEQIVFPEIDYDKVNKLSGLDICITTSATTDEEALALLRGFFLPFRGLVKAEEQQ